MQCYLMQGTTKTDLMVDSYHVLDGFYPHAPVADAGSVVERITLWVLSGSGKSVTDIVASVRALETLLEQARDSVVQREGWNGVYLHYSPDDGATEVPRARVIGGTLEFDGALGRYIRAERVRVTLVVERWPFWEGNLATLMMSNDNGSGTSVRVYNCNDGSGSIPSKRQNMLTIAGSALMGTLPAPIKLTCQPSANINRVMVGHWAYKGVTPTTWHVEAESMVGGTTYSDAACSNGSYKRVSMSSSMSALLYYPFAYGAFRREYLMLWARFRGAPPANTRLQVRVDIGGDTSQDLPSQYLTADMQQMLGVGQMPPTEITSNMTATVTVRLMGSNAGGGNLEMDVVYMMPLDSWAWMTRSDSVVISSSQTMVEDWIEGQSYREQGGGSKRRFFTRRLGPGIWLWPGVENRLAFLAWDGAGSDITRYLTVTAAYRPRWRTI